MRLRDSIRLGLDQMRRRKVVTMLCTMGLAIGSASIIVAISFGESVTTYSQERMSFYLKTDEITVTSGRPPDNEPVKPYETATYAITKPKIDLIRTLPNVKTVASFQQLDSFRFQVDGTKSGFLNNVTATELETLPAFDNEFAQGGPSDQENAIVLSYGATMALFDEKTSGGRSLDLQSASGARGGKQNQLLVSYPVYRKQIVLRPMRGDPNSELAKLRFPVTVVGVLKRPEGLSDELVSNMKSAYVPASLGAKIRQAMDEATGTVRSSVNVNGAFSQLVVKVDSSANVKQVDTWIGKLKLSSQTNLFREAQMKNEFVIVRIVFGGAGLFILFVASISIVVAMTMSTYQRRRQIGIMKVLGANLRQIRNMFIVESTLLGLTGGLVGILLSYWVVWGINIAIQQLAGEDMRLFISFWVLPVGLFFAILTGVLSGIYPAVKASQTDALTAIKRE